MKHFKIYSHPQGSTETIKQGWSWPAFFFGWIWALVKKMWHLGAGVIVVFFVLGIIAAIAGGKAEETLTALTGLAAIVLSIVFGVNGNKWREKNIASRGFEYKDTVAAANADGAMALYIKRSNLTMHA